MESEFKRIFKEVQNEQHVRAKILMEQDPSLDPQIAYQQAGYGLAREYEEKLKLLNTDKK